MMKPQVVVVGAGVVGLTSALLLARRGIRVTLLEGKAGTSIHPRAAGLQVRTWEIFRAAGVADAVAEAGRPLRRVSGMQHGRTLVSADLPPAPSERDWAERHLAYSPVVGGPCTQDVLEPVLLDAARWHGAVVEFGATVSRVEQDRDGVTAVLTDGRRIGADYLVAADGVGSTVRKALGIPFDGPGAVGPRTLNILFRADLTAITAGREFILCRIENPDVSCMIMAVDQRERWVMHVPDDPTVDEGRAAELVRAAVGLPDLDVTVLSIAPWTPTAAVAGRFRDGRVFLAGDAAHAVPPTGALGSSTGIADADNLAWKLALVLRGEAGVGLLGTYEEERLPVARFTMDQAVLRMGRMDLHFGAGGAAAREAVGMADGTVVSLGYQYRSGAIIGGRDALPDRQCVERDLDGHPGSRLPHRWVRPGVSTLDLVAETGLTLFTEDDGWAAAAGALTVRRVDPGSVAALVRPDGFVAWRTDEPAGDPGPVVAAVLARQSGSTSEKPVVM